jgi:hypothetical protein
LTAVCCEEVGGPDPIAGVAADTAVTLGAGGGGRTVAALGVRSAKRGGKIREAVLAQALKQGFAKLKNDARATEDAGDEDTAEGG